MIFSPLWLYIIAGVVLVGGLVYWQLIIAEGTYLGQHVVTYLYDIVAGRYDAIKQYDQELEDLFLGRPLARSLNGHRAPLVLDIATGTARLPLALLSQPDFQGKIIGLDASRRMLSVAARKTRRYAGRLHLVWRDAAALPFPDAVFDCVTCLEMLEFTPDPEQQLVEAVRVLRPGGVLLTTRRRGFDARLMPGKTHDPDAFQAMLAGIGMVSILIRPWQMDYDLVWAVRSGDSRPVMATFEEVLVCPACGSTGVSPAEDSLRCLGCGRVYPVVDGVLDLTLS